jgi:hypothetical protein
LLLLPFLSSSSPCAFLHSISSIVSSSFIAQQPFFFFFFSLSSQISSGFFLFSIEIDEGADAGVEVGAAAALDWRRSWARPGQEIDGETR